MGTGEIRGKQATAPLTKAQGTPPPPPPKPQPKTPAAGDTAKLTDPARTGQRTAAQDLANYPIPDKETQIQQLLEEGKDEGIVGSAVAYWHEMRKEDGASGYVGAVMETLLEFSGLPAVERSAGELGARVGMGDSNANIAKAGGKLALNSGLVVLNGIAGAGALGSAAKGAKAVVVGEAVVANGARATSMVVRHYTSAEAAAKVMASGELWASARGVLGKDKIYLLAESAGAKGLNFLRRLNIGMPKNTAVAIEIDLAKLPVEVAAKFKVSGFKGFLNQENFITHAGKFDFKAFEGAVRKVPTEQLVTTFDQVLKAGGTLAGFGTVVGDANHAAQGLANTAGN